VNIALAQSAALKIAELIEHKQRVIALAAKVAVPCGPFLIPMGGADGAVHVQCNTNDLTTLQISELDLTFG
jgi:hypothetical protein